MTLSSELAEKLSGMTMICEPHNMAKLPKEGEIVFIRGGIAQYRNGVFYTGMEDPRYMRPIQWEVKWWIPLNGSDSEENLLNRANVRTVMRDAEREVWNGKITKLSELIEYLRNRL